MKRLKRTAKEFKRFTPNIASLINAVDCGKNDYGQTVYKYKDTYFIFDSYGLNIPYIENDINGVDTRDIFNIEREMKSPFSTEQLQENLDKINDLVIQKRKETQDIYTNQIEEAKQKLQEIETEYDIYINETAIDMMVDYPWWESQKNADNVKYIYQGYSSLNKWFLSTTKSIKETLNGDMNYAIDAINAIMNGEISKTLEYYKNSFEKQLNK